MTLPYYGACKGPPNFTGHSNLDLIKGNVSNVKDYSVSLRVWKALSSLLGRLSPQSDDLLSVEYT